MKTKTIDIQAKEYFDKVNGNSYFSALVTVNLMMKGEKSFKLPFQYGYDRASEQAAKDLLLKEGLINTVSNMELREQGIVIRANKKENCTQREVKNYV